MTIVRNVFVIGPVVFDKKIFIVFPFGIEIFEQQQVQGAALRQHYN